MTLLKTIRLATHALSRNVTRSALTILGIVIGIAAVIIMMEIGKGSSAQIRKTSLKKTVLGLNVSFNGQGDIKGGQFGIWKANSSGSFLPVG